MTDGSGARKAAKSVRAPGSDRSLHAELWIKVAAGEWKDMCGAEESSLWLVARIRLPTVYYGDASGVLDFE